MKYQHEQPLFVEGEIRTNSGIYIKVANPTPDMIDIDDIAHALSHQCRFAGHLPVFYSVAEHSVHCAEMLLESHPELALCGLLHDASEAYLLDIPSPIKPLLTNYYELESNIMGVIADKYGFRFPLPKPVKVVDEQMLYSEWHNIKMGGKVRYAQPWTSKLAKTKFLKMFKQLTDERVGTTNN